MTDLTPADLAKFAHPVPVGAVIPPATPYAYLARHAAQIGVRSQGIPYESTQMASAPRWTAEPILTPEQQRLEDEYSAACAEVRAAEDKIRAASAERDARACTAQHLARRLREAGYR